MIELVRFRRRKLCLNDYRELAKVLGTPPMFTDVLPLILKPQEVEILLKVSEGEPSVKEISEILDLPASTVESCLNSLFKRGFLRKRREGETRYSLKPFNSIVSRHLSEGRTSPFGKYVSALANYTMQEHIERAKADTNPEAKVLPIPRGHRGASLSRPTARDRIVHPEEGEDNFPQELRLQDDLPQLRRP